MKPYPRAERVGVKIQSAVSHLLSKKLMDPRIEMATISRVKVTADLSIAYVYFAVFGSEEDVAEAAEGFKSSRGFIKKRIAPELKLKYMPELKFRHDDSFDKGARLDHIIDSVTKL